MNPQLTLNSEPRMAGGRQRSGRTAQNSVPAARAPHAIEKMLTAGASDSPVVASNFSSPLFILALPRSFSSVVCAMLGQHPQMYGLPETNLFAAPTLAEWWRLSTRLAFPMRHGLLRAVAQIYFAAQTAETVKLAAGWIKRRAHFTTGYMLEVLAEKLRPAVLVDKSPNIVRRVEFMHRAHNMFPQARFIHLTRHPQGLGESMIRFFEHRQKVDPVPPDHWLLRLMRQRGAQGAGDDGVLDPQHAWHLMHANVCKFLESVPENQKLRVRGEDVLRDPDAGLRQVVEWLGLRTDAEAMEMMKHPERSPYACFGPPGARFGNDPFFLKSPALRPWRAGPQSLDGPLTWRDDGQGFLPKVRRLAQQFGYE
jgi:hypothetical protein